ncbi:MAG: NIPSNAP family containing protein [Chloroflexi bacterium]|nr:NIPSNAP family containing protein [Chloroflexota bacterium]
MFIELRQYRIKQNRVAEWVTLMEEVIIPFQVGKGMVVIGSFTAPNDPDLYVWLRRFESEEQREALYRVVYESDEWRNEIAPQINELLDRERIVVTRLEPTASSALR